MPYVGNDVVDLRESANTGKSKNLRFLKKILTDAEIEFVKNAENPESALWSLWACKEAAYKVKKKSFPGTAFIPRRWQVVFNKPQSTHSDGEVIIPETGTVFIRLFPNPQYIHCVAVDCLASLDKLIWSIESVPEEKNVNPSLYLRHFLGQNLAQYLSLNFRQIEIKRTRENGELLPPRVYIDGKKASIDISLSHDGRFVAYAFLS